MSELAGDPLRVLLRQHLSGFEQLHALLFLARGAEKAWLPAEVAPAIGLPVELAETALRELADAGRLVTASGRGAGARFSFAPAGAVERDLVAELARVYDEQPLVVMRMMNENALERVRSTAAHRLAEAFRLDRKRK